MDAAHDISYPKTKTVSFQKQVSEKERFSIKDPGSAITHFIGMAAAAAGAVPLLLKAAMKPGALPFAAMAVYALSLILLYAASTAYHTFDLDERKNKLLKKTDHMMIFILIAGSYTPICLLALSAQTGIPMLLAVWIIALLGIILKAFWIFCPKWVSSILYIGMGWICLAVLPEIFRSLCTAAFCWLLAGGLIYTAGGVLYALKLSVFNGKHRNFGSHEIFHLFVMGGSLCHYIVMYAYVL